MRRTLPVSLVLPCYRREEQTRDLLRSLADADFVCEILLVDDASPVPLETLARSFPSLGIQYFRTDENAGPAHCRNLGVSKASEEIVAFTDNDCRVAADWLSRLYDSISQSPAAIAGIGGRVVAAGNDIFSQYYDYHKILDPWYFRGKIHYLTTANAIFRRTPLEIVEGFDATVRKAGGEDPGLCFKLQNAGYGLGYNPDALVHHKYEASFKAFMRTFFRYGYGCAGQSAKHFRLQPFVSEDAFGALDPLDP